VTDENQTLPPQGSDESQQGDPNNQSMESLLANEDLSVDMPQAGQIRTGTIASISPSQILVSIGAKSEGIVSGRELDQLSASEREALTVGAEIPVYVQNPEDENGNVVLSLQRARSRSLGNRREDAGRGPCL
jgi:small subunit ribosomal protein S1